MRLSELKALIAQIEAETLSINPDPTIHFWHTRGPHLTEIGLGDGESFVDFDIDTTHEMREHRIGHTDSQVAQVRGDFTLPLVKVPFYKL